MTPEELAAIAARTDANASASVALAGDIRTLVAEVRRLRDALREIAEPEATPARSLDDCEAAYDMGFADGWNDAALMAQKALES